jgi:hypothetical protein
MPRPAKLGRFLVGGRPAGDFFETEVIGDEEMEVAIELLEQLGIRRVPTKAQRRRGEFETCCGAAIGKLIQDYGLAHTTLTLRTVTESNGNSGQLIEDVILAISDIIWHHPRWADAGLRWLEAFDQINLAEIRRVAKATKVGPLRNAIMTLLCVELEKQLGPSEPSTLSGLRAAARGPLKSGQSVQTAFTTPVD